MMERKWWLLVAFLAIIVIPIVWYLISPAFIVVEMNETSPLGALNGSVTSANVTLIERPAVILQGEFKPSAHDVSGKAKIIEVEGKRILRFEDFETINGPDLFIYLSKDLSNKDFVDLGEIKATKGNVNYNLNSSVDISKYKNVLVWCRAFRVLFSYAELK